MKKGQMIEIETRNKIGKVKLTLYVLKVSSTGVVAMEKNGQEHWLSPNMAKAAKVIKKEMPKAITIGPHHRLLLKKGLVQRTKIRRRKEDARRQHIYK